MEGIRRFKTDKAFAKKIIAKYLRVADNKVLEETHQLFSELFERVPYVKREGLVSLAQILADKDSKAEAVKVDSIVDDRFVRELETSGFIKNLYRESERNPFPSERCNTCASPVEEWNTKTA